MQIVQFGLLLLCGEVLPLSVWVPTGFFGFASLSQCGLATLNYPKVQVCVCIYMMSCNGLVSLSVPPESTVILLNE